MTAREVMSADEVQRAIERLGREIVARQGEALDLALVGVERRGPELALRIAASIQAFEGITVPVIAIDVTPFRDDRGGAFDADAAAVIPVPSLRSYDPARTTVILVDDVLFTGRTVRAALEALMSHGRPAAVRLAVLVDRGHRELPITADFVGVTVTTTRSQRIDLRLGSPDGGEDHVLLVDARA